MAALARVELVDCGQEANVSFADEVGQVHSAMAVFFGDVHDKAQVGRGDFFAGGLVSGLCLGRKVVFFLAGQKRNLVDFVEIH